MDETKVNFAIESLQKSKRDHMSNCYDFRNHGFINKKETNKIVEKIDSYYDPIISVLKSWEKK